MNSELLALRALVALHTERPGDSITTLDTSRVGLDDFTTKATQALFAAVERRMRERKPIEIVGLMNVTKQNAPNAVVLDLMAGDNPDYAAERLEVVHSAGIRRRMVEQLEGLVAMAKSDAALANVESEVAKALQALGADTARGPRTADAAMMSLIDKLEAVQNGDKQPLTPTGIEALDYAMGGLRPTLTIVGALPGVGKSALFVSIARNLAQAGTRVGVVSLEDEQEWVAERILAEQADVPLFVLGTRPLHPGQMDRIRASSNAVFNILNKILIDDTAAMSPAQVVASARSMVARGCKAILVDHLGEIRLERTERHDLDILTALQDLRGIAKAYAVPVVVACHLRRRDGLDPSSIPKLTDFAFSAAIERSARVALGLFNAVDKDTKDPKLGVQMLKQTKGPKDFTFGLDLGARFGTVQQTAPSKELKDLIGQWRDK